MEQAGEWGMVGRQRVEAMVQTLASLGSRGESLAEVAHDARNMVTALGLYCDLLEEPGVLAVPFAHYGHELRLVAAASRRLVEKLVALDAQAGAGDETSGAVPRGATATEPARLAPFGIDLEQIPGEAPDFEASLNAEFEQGGRDSGIVPAPQARAENGVESRGRGAGTGAGLGEARFLPGRERARSWETLLSAPVDNLAAELLANRNLLSALAGPGIAVTVDAEGGARPVRLTAEDLTRLLVNLVKNAAEAIPAAAGPGHIQISLRECEPERGIPPSLLVAIEDNGPGIPAEALARVFDSGFTTRARANGNGSGWPVLHRGLGLAIARSLVEAAGGRISAANREQGGARIALELPVRAA